MSCCCSQPQKINPAYCPICEEKGLSVTHRTMLHQLQHPENQSIADEDYYFCANQHCDVGYFSEHTTMLRHTLRVFQAQQKNMLCYCFDISQEKFQVALEKGEAEAIKDFVLNNTKEALCACEVRNPSGRCCLGSFTKMEAIYEKNANKNGNNF